MGEEMHGVVSWSVSRGLDEVDRKGRIGGGKIAHRHSFNSFEVGIADTADETIPLSLDQPLKILSIRECSRLSRNAIGRRIHRIVKRSLPRPKTGCYNTAPVVLPNQFTVHTINSANDSTLLSIIAFNGIRSIMPHAHLV